MKIPAIVSAILALIAVALLFFIDFSDPNKREDFKLEELTSSTGDKQTEQLDALFARQALPAGQEINILKWIFVENNEYGIQLVTENAKSIERLPHFLGRTGIDLIKTNDPESARRALDLARRFFPNDPDVLTAIGMATYLAGNREAARSMLEQAKTWQEDIAETDFYLGLILLQSEAMADKARGKNYLKGLAESGTKEFSEQSALLLLTLPNIPMVEAETAELLDLLVEMDTFRADNEMLNPEIIRRLGNTATSVKPEISLELAKLLVDSPDGTVSDNIVLILLLNNAGDYASAAEVLDELQQDSSLHMEDYERDELARLQAFGQLTSEQYPQATESFTILSQTQGSEPKFHDLFRKALSLDIPIDTQKELLPLYLDLPVLSPQLTLLVLERLMDIAPLKADQWADHAAEKILPDNPMVGAHWLAQHNQQAKAIASLESIETPLTRQQHMALIEANLALMDAEAAQSALDQSKLVLEPVYFEFYQARIHTLRDERDLALERWYAAHNAALSSNSYEMMKNLGFLALELEQPVNALQSLHAAFTAGIPFSPNQANQLIALTLRFGNLKQSISVANYLYDSFPDEPIYLNNLAYFKFLAGEDLDKFVDLMRPLAKDYPDILNYRMTLGLGLLKSGRHNEAMRLMQSPPIDFNKTSTQGQVIYAAILIANGQQFVAEGLISSINQEELIPEERALIELQ